MNREKRPLCTTEKGAYGDDLFPRARSLWLFQVKDSKDATAYPSLERLEERVLLLVELQLGTEVPE